MPTTDQQCHLQQTLRHQECQQQTQQQRKKRDRRMQQEQRNLVFRLQKTLDHHFPDLYEKIAAIPDCRTQPQYTLVEILMAGTAMFLFKKGSRHAMNNDREEPEFRQNYERVFKARLPHMDTVEDVLRGLEAHELETLKVE